MMPRRVASASAPNSRSRSSLVSSGATLNTMVNYSGQLVAPQASMWPPLQRTRGLESVLEPTQIRVEYVARNEPGSDPAGDRLKLAVTNQRANLVLGATELRGNLAARQGSWPLHARSMAGASGRVSCSGRCRQRPAREVPGRAATPPLRAPGASHQRAPHFFGGTVSVVSSAPRRSRRDCGEVLVHEAHDHRALAHRGCAALDRS